MQFSLYRLPDVIGINSAVLEMLYVDLKTGSSHFGAHNIRASMFSRRGRFKSRPSGLWLQLENTTFKMDGIQLSQNRVQWRAFMNMVMTLLVPKEETASWPA